jgi:predicted GH43/DUF377 family glycosyl hydrolase
VKAFRSPNNPIIGPKDVKPSRDDFEVIGTFNAGVSRLGDEVILLLRVAERPISQHPEVVLVPVFDAEQGAIITEKFLKDDPENDFSDPRLIIKSGRTYLTSISQLRLARSSDGINFKIDEEPALTAANEYESFGIEDPRITCIDGTYYVNYVAVSPFGVTTCLASTKDFKSFERHGAIFCPENKDVAIFAEKVDGRYFALHRPVSPLFNRSEMWIAESPNLVCWGNHRYLMGVREGCWDEVKIGASAVPIKIEQGWLEIYHGSNRDNRYCLGAVLLDAKDPAQIIARAAEPILEPEADYEIEGFFGNVVFSCGLLCENDQLKIYYGVADTSIAYAEVSLQDVVEKLNL